MPSQLETGDGIERLGHYLAQRPPRILSGADKRQAAVAVVLRSGAMGGELLLIERARRQGDPWSGHLGFPGGSIEREDGGDLEKTARRETHEELGLDLAAARCLGRLDDEDAAVATMVVAAWAYRWEGPCRWTASDEVEDAFWIPIDCLRDAGRRTQCRYRVRGEERVFPAIEVLGPGRPLLWGLTYRFVGQVLQHLGDPLPAGVEADGP